MVDISIDEMKQFVAAYEAMKNSAGDTSALDQMKTSLKEMTPLISEWKEKVRQSSSVLSAWSTAKDKISFGSLKSGLDSTLILINKLTKDTDVSIESIKNLTTQVGALYALGSGRLALSQELMSLGNVADGTSAQLSTMFSTISNVAPELVNKFGKLGPGLKRALGQVDAAKKLETSLLMNAAAAGYLDTALDSLDGNISNLSDMTLEFARLTSESGTANNISAGAAAKYASSLMKIPGALGIIIDNVDSAGTNMNMLDATIKVASGTFQTFEDVMQDVNLLFLNWNKTGKDSLTFVSKLHSASQTLKMPMDIMRSYVHDVGNQFKFLGDNTMSAIDIMTRFSPALRDSGLGPAAVNELVKNMTGAVSQMDVAQRSFLSARTGGPGGLQGGYQIAQQMAEGDMAGVFGKVEDALKGMFDGQIVTLKQASEDARAAAQFTKQVQMLTSGPLAIAGSESEAFKILEALASGGVPDIADLKGASPEEQLQDVMNRGNSIQDRQFNELVAINNKLELFGALAADVAYAGVRQGIGPGTDLGQQRAQRMRDIRTLATETASTRMFQRERPLRGRDQELSMIGSEAREFGRNFVQGAKNLLSGLADRTPDLPKKSLDLPKMIEAPKSRVRQDLAALERERQPEKKDAPRQKGSDNTVVIQVRSDSEIKKVVKFMIEEDGSLRQLNEGKVVPGL